LIADTFTAQNHTRKQKKDEEGKKGKREVWEEEKPPALLLQVSDLAH
jgi:hypothetical protein